jgi:hypothetical protein
LRAVRIDGWKQAWLLPAGTAGTVILTYPPDTLYRYAIFGGLGTLGLVMLVALWPGQPAWRPRWLRGWSRRAPERRVTGPHAEATGEGPETVLPVAAAREAASTEAAGPVTEAEAASTEAAKPGAEAASTKAAGPGAGLEPASTEAEPGAGQRAAGDEAAEPEAARLASPGRSRPHRRPRPAAALTVAAAVCCLALAGLWLGGYPGAAILPAAAALFAVSVSCRHVHPAWYQVSRPWVPAALLMSAAACGVVGGQLMPDGTTGTVVTVLTNTAPQVLCLAVVGRLAAELVVDDP